FWKARRGGMEEDLDFLKKQWEKTEERAVMSGRVLYGGFYSETEMGAFDQLQREGRLQSAAAFGGYEGADRCMLRFGDADEDAAWPIACVLIAPRSAKYAEAWSHRDVLGALMSLGVERDVLGDLRLAGGQCYAFCRAEMAEHVMTLDSVRKTSVACSLIEDAKDIPRPEKQLERVAAASERIDALTAELANLSRGKAAELIARQRVLVAGQVCLDPSRKLREGEVFSIRGTGKFRYLGLRGASKKGRLYLEIERWM
ncbi:MAG: hypothetical protein IJ174_06200, partial [Clostridia bacterium]|nr:hypothetical protein [Clostridia bacterium]